jgi:pre-mRNA-splicing factor SPF27
MRSEFERMQQRQPMDVLSMKRYELPPPPAGKMTDIAAWTECVENSMAQLEHQATRFVYNYYHYLTFKILLLNCI